MFFMWLKPKNFENYEIFFVMLSGITLGSMGATRNCKQILSACFSFFLRFKWIQEIVKCYYREVQSENLGVQWIWEVKYLW